MKPETRSTLTATRRFLHVGCGESRKDATTPVFAGEDWREIRLDINPDVRPDILGSMTDMTAVADHSVDAIFSSHNLEHLYVHEVPAALREFKRVLQPMGFVVLTCPDLQGICSLVAEGKLLEPAYQSASGPISPLDVLYGHRAALAKGQLHMAHRCGFTRHVLLGVFRQHGFAQVVVMQRSAPWYDLWLLALVKPLDERSLETLVDHHFPREDRGPAVGEF